MSIDPVWHKEQVSKYINEFPIYEEYAKVLMEILNRACKLYAPLAVVQARAKTVSSFAEKAARKAHKYYTPVNQITDLCGARVITQTLDEVEEICDFIKANFRVDEANSLDTRTRLSETEFGYRSVHFVIQLKDDELLGMPMPVAKIGERKAEIQVRTLLQHAWSDISHDRLYKQEFKIPEGARRDGAMLAATLEDADGAFSRFIKNLDTYAGHYTAYMTKDKMQAEIEIQKMILQNEPVKKNKPGIALKIAKIAKAEGDYGTVIEILEPFKKVEGSHSNEILLELGNGLCRKYRDNPKSAEFKRGQTLMKDVTQHLAAAILKKGPGSKQAKSLSATACSLLARSYRDITGRESQARDMYHQALLHDPANPYHLASLLEYEIFCTRNSEFVHAMHPTLLEAIKTCRAHADAGIELPQAFFTMGRFYLLLEQPFESLDSYAKGIQLCLAENACVSEDVIDNELEFLRRVNLARELPPEHEWIRELLLLGKSIKTVKSGVSDDIKDMILQEDQFKSPVLIIAGGADEAFQKEMSTYREYLEQALSDFEGTVISGGTTAGIPGIVGEITEKLRRQGTKNYLAICYLSKYLPSDASKDMRYDKHHITAGETLSPHEPLQNWIDLLAAGVKPSDVRVLGINGGRIAAFEYKLALALGATVGLVDFSGRAASELLSTADWLDSPNLLQLPKDIMSVRAFVNAGRSQLSPKVIETMAQAGHAKFLEDNKHTKIDPSMLPYDKLREDLKDSNRQQAIYAEQILKQVGFGVRQKKKESIKLVKFTPEQVEIMAEMEHGRWNVERLKARWKRGPDRIVEKKISPFLVSWKDLPEDIKKWDRKAVTDWPGIFKGVGLEIYKSDSL